jgi:hypothetical protein
MKITQPMPKLADGRNPVITSNVLDHFGRTPPGRGGVDMMYVRGRMETAADLSPLELARHLLPEGSAGHRKLKFKRTPGAAIPERATADFEVPLRTPAIAMAIGNVVRVEPQEKGFVVELDHSQGIHSIYRHLRSPQVRDGQLVQGGQELATVSFDPTKGKAKVPHLHLEMSLNGKLFDPEPMLRIIPAVRAGTSPLDVDDQELLRALELARRGKGGGGSFWLWILAILILSSKK